MDPNQMIEEKQGKKKKQKVITKSGNVDLRKYPHFMQDGDIIGVRLGKDNEDGLDDFQTDADQISKADFILARKN